MLREKISEPKIQSFPFWKNLSGFFTAFFFLLASCTNIGRISGSPTSLLSLAPPGSGANGGNFSLIAVYASQQAPGTLYDLVGTNNEFEVYCNSTNGPCVCEYTYVSPGTGTVTDQGSVVYQESNLIRCLNAVPSGVTSFDVRILATVSNDVSNTLTVNLASNGFVNSSYIDLSKEESYSMVKRFQCRKREFIQNPMSPNLIDVIQAEDPKVIYPFNYYTTNVGESLWSLQQNDNQDWDCTLTPTHDGSVHWWANANVYSATICSSTFCLGDLELLYPQNDLVSGKIPITNLSANGKRRASFHLAKQAYGAFQVPVRAAIGPKDYVSAKYGIIGYAARPVPVSGGTSACPNIPIPSNAEWVKLWNFRAMNINPPKVVTGSQSMTNSAIACNTTPNVFPSCDKPGAVGGASTSWRSQELADLTSSPPTISFASPLIPQPNGAQLNYSVSLLNQTIASRVAVITSNASGGNLSPDVCYNIQAMGNGQESWHPSPFGFSGLGVGVIQGLPWNIMSQVIGKDTCGSSYDWLDHAMTSGFCAGFTLMEDEPSDTQLSTQTLNPVNYTDQLFVITDDQVNDDYMRNDALAVSEYKPVTYRTSTDCNTASRSGCPISKEINWAINVKEVDAPTGPDQYPLCVLQFSD